MKTRTGFVSNSSSSSFILELIPLNIGLAFLNNDTIHEMLDYARDRDWVCDVYKNYLIATTYMDNFDFREYLKMKYYIYGSNAITFGSYSGFDHNLDNLKNFIDIFLKIVPKPVVFHSTELAGGL